MTERRRSLVCVAFLVGVAAQLVACTTQPESNSVPPATGAPASPMDERAELSPLVNQFVGLEPMDVFQHDLPLAEAYRWQDIYVDLLGPTLGEVAGYKTGGHDSGPANPLFPPGGIRGFLLEGMIRPSGTAVRPEETVWGFLEADLAFRVGNDSINTAETDLEILAGLDALVPFLEIPDPAFKENRRSPTGTVVTNMASRYAFVGDPVPLEATDEWLARLNNLSFAVHDEDGTEIGTGTLNGFYQPIAVVRWLRDQLAESGRRLSPGHILSLGSIGITSPLKDGSPRGGPAYGGDQFTLSYYGLSDEGPATVTINIQR